MTLDNERGRQPRRLLELRLPEEIVDQSEGLSQAKGVASATAGRDGNRHVARGPRHSRKTHRVAPVPHIAVHSSNIPMPSVFNARLGKRGYLSLRTTMERGRVRSERDGDLRRQTASPVPSAGAHSGTILTSMTGGEPVLRSELDLWGAPCQSVHSQADVRSILRPSRS